MSRFAASMKDHSGLVDVPFVGIPQVYLGSPNAVSARSTSADL